MDLVGVWVVAGKVRGFVAAHLVCFGVRGRQQAVSVAVLACQPLAACRRRSAELPGRGQALVSLALHGQKRQASGRRLWVCDGSEERDGDRPSWLGLWESHRLEAEFVGAEKYFAREQPEELGCLLEFQLERESCASCRARELPAAKG